MIPAITAFASDGVVNATLDLVNMPFKDVVAHTDERRAMFEQGAEIVRASDTGLLVGVLTWMTRHANLVVSGLAWRSMAWLAFYDW